MRSGVTPQDALSGSRVLVQLGTPRGAKLVQLDTLRVHPPRVVVQALDWNPGVHERPDGGPYVGCHMGMRRQSTKLLAWTCVSSGIYMPLHHFSEGLQRIVAKCFPSSRLLDLSGRGLVTTAAWEGDG